MGVADLSFVELGRQWAALAVGLACSACHGLFGATGGAPPAAGAVDAAAEASGDDAAVPAADPDASTDAAVPPGIDAGEPDAGASDAGDPLDEVLTLEDGAFFTPTADDPMRRFDFGQDGVVYERVDLTLTFDAGEWQPEIPEGDARNRTEHILFGLFRARQQRNYQKYIAGAAAVTFDWRAPHLRMFGRTEIGEGYTTYTADSSQYGWQQGERYELHCWLDGAAHEQACELAQDGDVVATRTLDVSYLDPAAHLGTGFYLEIGTANADAIEASPLGWAFSDLLVTARRM